MRKKEQKVDEYGNPVEKSPTRTAFGVLVGMISAALFLIVFLRIWQARDAQISDRILLDGATSRCYSAYSLGQKAPSREASPLFFSPSGRPAFLCHSLHPSTTMDTDGRIQVKHVYYLQSAQNLQMTVRLNTRYYPQDNGLGYRFILKILNADGSVAYCTNSYQQQELRYGYTFLRLAFTGLSLRPDQTVRLQMLTKNGQPGDDAFLNLKIFGADVYAQQESPASLDFMLHS